MSPERSVAYVSGTDKKEMAGERGFELPTPWSRTRPSNWISEVTQGNKAGRLKANVREDTLPLETAPEDELVSGPRTQEPGCLLFSRRRRSFCSSKKLIRFTKASNFSGSCSVAACWHKVCHSTRISPFMAPSSTSGVSCIAQLNLR